MSSHSLWNIHFIGSYCTAKSKYWADTLDIWPHFIFVFLLPNVFLICANISIAVHLFRSQKLQQQHATNSAANNSMRSTTVMLLCDSSFSLLFNLPVNLYCLAVTYNSYDWYQMCLVTGIPAHLLQYIIYNLSYLNNALNFLLYCVSGSQFRKECKQIFGDGRLKIAGCVIAINQRLRSVCCADIQASSGEVNNDIELQTPVWSLWNEDYHCLTYLGLAPVCVRGNWSMSNLFDSCIFSSGLK